MMRFLIFPDAISHVLMPESGSMILMLSRKGPGDARHKGPGTQGFFQSHRSFPKSPKGCHVLQ